MRDLTVAFSMSICLLSHHSSSYLLTEKNCWSASEHCYWINWYNWHVGATGRRPSSVCNFWHLFYRVFRKLHFHCVDSAVIASLFLQSWDYSTCFNDHNHFFKEGAGYILHRVILVYQAVNAMTLCLQCNCIGVLSLGYTVHRQWWL